MPTFTIPNGSFPARLPQWVTLGPVNAGTYDISYAVTLLWDDLLPDTERIVGLACDLDAFDVSDNMVDWDSGVFLRIDERYLTTLGTQSRQLSGQVRVVLPNRLTLKMMVLDQSLRELVGNFRYENFSVTVTRV